MKINDQLEFFFFTCTSGYILNTIIQTLNLSDFNTVLKWHELCRSGKALSM